MADLLSRPQYVNADVDGLVQDCSNSIANALELLQSCTKTSMWYQPNDASTTFPL